MAKLSPATQQAVAIASKIEPLVSMGQHRFEPDPSLKLTNP